MSVCANRRNNGGEFVKSAVFLVGERDGQKKRECGKPGTNFYLIPGSHSD